MEPGGIGLSRVTSENKHRSMPICSLRSNFIEPDQVHRSSHLVTSPRKILRGYVKSFDDANIHEEEHLVSES